jgi:tRNA-2-methylthio-N6-dimethylallyladenosine synthase
MVTLRYMSERTFCIQTFGCQMNVNDSGWLARALTRRGFTEAAPETARVHVLNTCSVRDKPEQKVYSALGRVRQLTMGRPDRSDAFAVVAGCVARQIGAGFFRRFPQVRLVVGGDGLRMAPGAIERLCDEPDLKLDLTDFSTAYPERDPELTGAAHTGTAAVEPVAYATIMQGCDNFCAYCIVPYTRGRQKSRSASAVLDECRALLARGAREIVLLGQNVNAYGEDAYGDGTSFSRLLRLVARSGARRGGRRGLAPPALCDAAPQGFFAGDRGGLRRLADPGLQPAFARAVRLGRGSGAHGTRLYPKRLPAPGGEPV